MELTGTTLNRPTIGQNENYAGGDVCVLVGSVGVGQRTDHPTSPTCSNNQPRGIWSSPETRPNYVHGGCNTCAAGL